MVKQVEMQLNGKDSKSKSPAKHRPTHSFVEITKKRFRQMKRRENRSHAGTKQAQIEISPNVTVDQSMRDMGNQSPTGFSSRQSGSGGAQSPMGSQRENQLRLDLIDEEENIDRMLGDTGNFWNAEVMRNEDIYDR